MKILTNAFLIVFTLILLSSCQSSQNDEDNKLTQGELNDFITYTRVFLLKSNNVKITEKEKEFVKTKQPNVRVYYSDYKTGKIILSWPFSEMRMLNTYADGNLLKAQDCFWRISIIKNERKVNINKKK